MNKLNKNNSMDMKFFKCELCGQMVAMVKETGAELICCNQPMIEITPKTKETENFKEKHVPVYRLKGNKIIVYVGLIRHPSKEDHYIEWIAIKTNMGNQRKVLKPGDPPKATFVLDDNEYIEEIYAYCNLHSLWKYVETDKGDGKKRRCEIHM